MTIRTSINKHFLFPITDIIRGTRFVSRYNFLMKSQWWDKENIEEYQNTKLRKLIHHSYENVAYYNRLFKDNNLKPNEILTKADLLKIPPLTKNIVRNFATTDLLAKNVPKRRKITGQTGGSTGEPLQFYRDKNSKSWGIGGLHRFWDWSGLSFTEKKFQFSGGSLGGFLTQKSKIRLNLEKFMTGQHLFPAFEMNEKNMEKYLEIIEKNQNIKYLRGYPSSIYLLAKYIENHGINNIKFKAILTTAEKLYSFQKNDIEKAFNCKVFDQYGCGEILSIAAQCSINNQYHVTDEHVIVETGLNNIAQITDLDNFVSPFIRYENGDMLELSKTSCECGRQLSCLTKIEGRTHDYIVTSEKGLIAGEFFPHLFQNINGIDQYFILQQSINQLIVSVIPNEKFSQNELELYITKIKEYVGEEMQIEIDIVDEIPLTTSGKRLFIKSNVPIDWIID